jgi:hypothetical protein
MVQNPNLFSYAVSKREKTNDLPEYISVEPTGKAYFFGDEYPRNYSFNLIDIKSLKKS